MHLPLDLTGQPFMKTFPNTFFPNAKLIIGGDYNCIDQAIDKFGHKNLKLDYQLIDIWRILHPKNRQFTWFDSNMYIGSKFDKFLIPINYKSQTQACSIIPCTFSDHECVKLTIKNPDIISHGPGIWRLNTSLLKDEQYVETINNPINTHITYQEALPSKRE